MVTVKPTLALRAGLGPSLTTHSHASVIGETCVRYFFTCPDSIIASHPLGAANGDVRGVSVFF